MQVPLELSFKNVKKTDSVERLIREKADKLEKICGYMMSCRVSVERPQKHQERGNPYRVRVDMRVPPGHELVAKRESSKGDMHDPLPVVIRKAFGAAEKRLKHLMELQRGEVKSHPAQQVMGMVQGVFKGDGYGFIRTQEGREIYFHRNSVLGDNFERLEVGTGVRFVVEEGEKGPQASTVEIVAK